MTAERGVPSGTGRNLGGAGQPKRALRRGARALARYRKADRVRACRFWGFGQACLLMASSVAKWSKTDHQEFNLVDQVQKYQAGAARSSVIFLLQHLQ